MKRTLKRELKVRETVEREANGVSNSPCQIQPLVLRDAIALDPNGRGVRGRGSRAAHFWRASVSVVWRWAKRTREGGPALAAGC